jgi:hypothetical protein
MAKSKNVNKELFPLPDWCNGLSEEWGEFLSSREASDAGFPTLFAQKLLLKRLEEYSYKKVELARRIIENSIIGGQRGPYEKFYPLRDDCQQYNQPCQTKMDFRP